MTENDRMSPVPADHPLMIAWTAYQATEEYKNTFAWAMKAPHTQGSLWAAFEQGWRAALLSGWKAAGNVDGENPPQ